MCASAGAGAGAGASAGAGAGACGSGRVCLCVCVSACVCMSARVLVFVSAFVWSACPPSIFNSPAERTLTMALSRIRRSWAIFWCIKYAE